MLGQEVGGTTAITAQLVPSPKCFGYSSSMQYMQGRCLAFKIRQNLTFIKAYRSSSDFLLLVKFM